MEYNEQQAALERLQQAYEDAQQKAKRATAEMKKGHDQVTKQIKQQGKELNKLYTSISLETLLKDYKSLNDEIQKQRKLIASLHDEMEKMEQTSDSWEINEGYVQQLNQINAMLALANEQLTQMQTQAGHLQDAILTATQGMSDPANPWADQIAAMQNAQNTFQQMQTAGLNMANVVGNVSSQMSSLFGQIDTLSSGANIGKGLLSTLSSSFGIVGNVASLFGGIADVINAENEKRHQNLVSAAQNYTMYDPQIDSAKRYIAILKDENAALEEVQGAQKWFIRNYPNIVKGVDENNDAVMVSVETLEERIKAEERQEDLETRKLAEQYNVASGEFRKAGEAAMNEFSKNGQVSAETQQRLEEAKNNLILAETAFFEHWGGEELMQEQVDGIEQFYNRLVEAAITGDQKLIDELSKEADHGVTAQDINFSHPEEVTDFALLFYNSHRKSENMNLFSLLLKDFKKEGNNFSKEVQTSMTKMVATTKKTLQTEELQEQLQKAFELDTKVNPAEGLEDIRGALIVEFSKTGKTVEEASQEINGILANMDPEFADVVRKGQQNEIENVIKQKMAVAEGPVYEYWNKMLGLASVLASAGQLIPNALGGMTVESTPPSIKTGGGGGGGSRKNKALDNELALLEHKKALNQVTAQEEIAWLERVYRKYAKTTEEKRKLEEQLYQARLEMQQNEIEYQKSMDQLTLREEIAANERLLSQYKAGTQARKDLEVEIYEMKKELQRQEYDLQVEYGKLTLAEQEARLKQMINQYKAGTETRIDLERELYDVQQQIYEENVSKVDTILDGLTTALQNRYAEQQELENKRIDESIENWQRWGDEQTEAIQKQIDALDELTQEEDRAEEERKKKRKIASLEQQIAYENDAYNRRKLQEQLESAQKEYDDWVRQKEREDQKKALQEQMDAVNERVQAEQDALEEQREKNDAIYEELTKQQNLEAEAIKILMEGGQTEILDLLKNFAPEYNLTGQSLGEQLVDGFEKRVGDIEKWFENMSERFEQFQAQMADVATQAADQFYQTHGIVSTMSKPEMTGAPIIQQVPQVTVNFNQPVQNPTEMRRELERLLQNMALM